MLPLPDLRPARPPSACPRLIWPGHPALLARVALLACAGFFQGPFLSSRAEEPKVTTVPGALVNSLQLSPFYKKFTSARGLPVLGSSAPSDYALLEATYLIDRMLEGREDIRQAMISNKVRFVVMGFQEYTTAIPEHSTLEPAKFWDKRARGLGATRRRPVVSCGEENLLGYPGDPYSAENILIHEFSHAIHQMGLNTVDPSFDGRLKDAYAKAIAAGLWKGTYAGTNPGEYWAEAVQSWFDTNRENDAQHNHVNTREELKAHDPVVSGLVAEVFGDRAWRYSKPAKRPAAERVHLDGFDPAKAGKFAWPRELLEWNQQYAANLEKPESERISLTLKPGGPGAVCDPVPTLRDTSILFTNKRPAAVVLYRVASSGARERAARLEPGEKRSLPSYAGQTWLITDLANQPLGTVFSTTEPAKLIIE